MVEDALEVGRVLPGDLLLQLTSLLLTTLKVALQDHKSLCIATYNSKFTVIDLTAWNTHQKKP